MLQKVDYQLINAKAGARQAFSSLPENINFSHKTFISQIIFELCFYASETLSLYYEFFEMYNSIHKMLQEVPEDQSNIQEIHDEINEIEKMALPFLNLLKDKNDCDELFPSSYDDQINEFYKIMTDITSKIAINLVKDKIPEEDWYYFLEEIAVGIYNRFYKDIKEGIVYNTKNIALINELKEMSKIRYQLSLTLIDSDIWKNYKKTQEEWRSQIKYKIMFNEDTDYIVYTG